MVGPRRPSGGRETQRARERDGRRGRNVNDRGREGKMNRMETMKVRRKEWKGGSKSLKAKLMEGWRIRLVS